MWFNIENRDKEYVNELRAFIAHHYGLAINSIREHNRGWYGETWKIDASAPAGADAPLFVKIIYFPRQAKKYKKCFRVLDYMSAHGIDFTSQVIHTRENKPYLMFRGGVLALFRFVNGAHAEDIPTKFVPYMVKIYKLKNPPFRVSRERFSTVADFRYLKRQMRKLQADAEAFGIVKSHWDLLKEVHAREKDYARKCRKKLRGRARVITSGDIGGNALEHDGKITIIDWDYIKLGYPERDFWFYVQVAGAIDAINAAFAAAGFDYILDNDVLGYYAFNSYIYFLCETIDCLLFNPASRPQILGRLRDHFDKNFDLRKCLTSVENS